MLNDPLAMSLLIGGIIIVAIALILYFLIFRKKIKDSLSAKKANKQSKAEADDKARALAANALAEKKETDEKLTKEQQKSADDRIKRFVNINSAVGTSTPAKTIVAKKTTTPKPVEAKQVEIKPSNLKDIDMLKQLKKDN